MHTYPSPLFIGLMLFVFFLLLLKFVAFLAAVSAVLKGESFSFKKLPHLILFGLKVWMGIALDDPHKKEKEKTPLEK